MTQAGPVLDAFLRSVEPSIRWRAQVQVFEEDRDSRGICRLEREIVQSLDG